MNMFTTFIEIVYRFGYVCMCVFTYKLMDSWTDDRQTDGIEIFTSFYNLYNRLQ